jgi:hypothetical protein
MTRSSRIAAHPVALALAGVFGLALTVSQFAQAQTFEVLYSFAGYPTDGAGPGAGLLMDASGNLYGTTAFGGKVNGAHCGSSGYIGKKVRISQSQTCSGHGRRDLSLIVVQHAVKLSHQVSELHLIIFPNDSVSEVLPCFHGVAVHSGSFSTAIGCATLLGCDQSIPHTNDRTVIHQPRFKHSVSSCPTLPA